MSTENNVRPEGCTKNTVRPEGCTKNTVRPEGCTVLSDNEHEQAIVDIVLVHGLQGHPYGTWSLAKSSASSVSEASLHNGSGSDVKKKKKGLRKLFSGLGPKRDSSSHLEVPETDESSNVYWPKDLLANDFRNARVMTYGYDSSVSHFFSGAANQNNISAHGTNLLNRLVRERRNCPQRPIIFIVHSLGGLVLKRALIVSRDAIAEKQDLKDIYQCTLGILFFGTPHRGGGGNYADWGIIASRVVRAVGFDANDNIVRNLRIDSEILSILREEFSKMLGDKAFQIDTFQEERGFHGVRGLTGKIVEDASSALDDAREYKHTINANHINMCRFRGPQDEGYLEVKDVITKYMNGMQRVLTDESSACLTSLYEPLMDLEVIGSRYYQIRSNYEATLGWISEMPSRSDAPTWHHLPEWLLNGTGLFWIRGIPGSGKSTAMKYIYSHGKTREALPSQAWVCPAVFLHNRGSPMQKTFEGLLRSLLVQILSGAKDLIPLVSRHGSELTALRRLQMQENYKTTHQTFRWTVDNLKAALEAVMTESPRLLKICMFIDALDEHEGDHEEMAQYLKKLLSFSGKANTHLKLLVSSREEAVFTDEFSAITRNQNLQIHKWTKPDIDVYIRGRLGRQPAMNTFIKSEDPGEREDADELMSSIESRARGVFLWVQLVVDDLTVALRTGPTSLDPLRKRLDSLLDELPDFYRQILERIDVPNVLEAYVLIEGVLHAYQPLTLLQLAHLKDVAIRHLQHEDVELTEARMSQLKRRAPSLIHGLKELCKGLLQVHPPPPSDTLEMPHSDDRTSSQAYFIGHNDDFGRRFNGDGHHDLGGYIEQKSVEEMEPSEQLRCTVQLLHQSVKDYLLQPESLSLLFNKASKLTIPRPIENGHVFILQLCLQVARFSVRLNRPTCNISAASTFWECAEWTLHHAPEAEKTTKMDLSDLLDNIDQYLTMGETICWPENTRIFRVRGVPIQWKITFLAYAVSRNMQIYVKLRLARDRKAVNGKAGIPLLFFAIHVPISGNQRGTIVDPAMVELLLKNGADARKKWGAEDILSAVLIWNRLFCREHDQERRCRDIIVQLLRAGADPNGQFVQYDIPVLHDIIRLRLDPDSKLDLLKTFKEYGADFRVQNESCLGVLDEVFKYMYEGQRATTGVMLEPPAPNSFSFEGIQWLFDQGAVISHEETYTHPDFKQSMFYREEFRKPQYYSYKAWQAVRSQHHAWGRWYPFHHRLLGR